MNLKENNKTDKNTVELVVEVKGDEFKAAVDAAFKKNIAKMTVPGFRKGKAPRKMVEKLYGEGVFYDDAINALYPAAYDAAVAQAGISPVDNPAVEVTSVDSEGFEFKAKVTVKPEVEVKDYKGIKAVKNVYNVTETMVKGEIEALRKQNQRIVDVDREAKSGDTVNIDYEGSVDGVPFEVVAFTNLSEDHIGPGEHPDFEDYKCAKRRLFAEYNARTMVYNVDDPYSDFMREGFKGEQISFGIQNAADYHGQDLAQYRSQTALGVDFDCVHAGETTHIEVMSPGTFSASDALCAVALCGAFGVTPAQAAATLAHTPVQGRFEVVEGLPGRTFIVDYSHNGLALTSALKTLRAYNPHRLLCVFGSVGGRTQVRRKELADASSAYADYTIITSDNPDNEPPEDVIRDIAGHMAPGAPYTCITDRREAIYAAVKMAEPGDIVLFAGKGHEDYQLINGKKLHFVEREIIKEACAEISK